MIRVSTCAVRDTEKKIEGKYLVFKTSIAGIKPVYLSIMEVKLNSLTNPLCVNTN